ncbi:MAG: EAL domain-containing protein [Oceanococcus sp.]|nr:MAG: EAL domain-containing protein [Oceanococcus sp.]
MSALENPPRSGVKLPGLRSLRFSVLARNLSLIALVGGAAVLVNMQLLYAPLQQTHEALEQEQAHVLRASFQAAFEGAQNLSVALNAAVDSVWGERSRSMAVGRAILANAQQSQAVVGAALWVDPRYFSASKRCGASGDWLDVCAPDINEPLPQRISSIYWQLSNTASAATSEPVGQVLVSSVEQDTGVWLLALQSHRQPGCFWSGVYRETYLDRDVMACLIPLRRGERLVGVSAVLLDPTLMPAALKQPSTGEYVLVGADARVLASNLPGLKAGAALTQLSGADARLAAVAQALRRDAEQRKLQARSLVADWDTRIAALAKFDDSLSQEQLEQTLTDVGLAGLDDSNNVIAGMRIGDTTRYELGGGKTLLILGDSQAQWAGLPRSLWMALLASLGLLTCAVLLYHLLTTRLSITPLRRLIRQLDSSADDTPVEVGGSAEFVVLSQLLNLRHARVRELLKRDAGFQAAQQARSASRDDDAGWAVVDALPDAVVVANADGQIQYLNRAAETLCGHNLAQAQNRPFDKTFNVLDRRGKRPLGHLAQAATNVSQRDEPPLFATVRDAQQRNWPVAISRRVLQAGPDNSAAMVLVLHATRRGKAAREDNNPAATERDALTGCLSRLAFEAELQARCEAAKTDNTTFALLYLDVDRMSTLNKTSGKAAGDEFLRQLSRLIQSDVGEANPVYRLHDDKFAVLLNTADPAEAQVVAELLRADISSWKFEHADQQHAASVSIGLVHVSGQSGRAVDVLRQASELSQQAQQQGGGRVSASQIQTRRQPLRDERSWLAALTQGLAQDRFRLSTQKIQPLQQNNEATQAFDTVLSFEDDEGVELPAASFMPIAARHDLVQQLDRWMVARMLNQLAQDADTLATMAFCSIPLSVRSMQSPHFLDFLFEHLKSSGVKPDKICFDLNENDVQGQISSVRSFCHTMSQVGCRLSLSGVSTRPGSYELIKQLPVQLVRFDPLLTRQIDTDAVERLATESLHRIVYTLGKQSMVTQVHSENLLKLVQKIGIHYAQGDAVAAVSRKPFSDQ